MVNWKQSSQENKQRLCIIAYLPVFLVILDAVIITQLNLDLNLKLESVTETENST